ncbi:unnamed protein product, partial [Tilletia laevis]
IQPTLCIPSPPIPLALASTSTSLLFPCPITRPSVLQASVFSFLATRARRPAQTTDYGRSRPLSQKSFSGCVRRLLLAIHDCGL